MKAAFNKGQVVFQACQRFAEVGKSGTNGDKFIGAVMVGAVIERQVDSCGQKQATFFNRGNNDSIFGKKTKFANGCDIYATAEEAFAALKSGSCDVICPDVYSDEDASIFSDLSKGKMRIAAK